MLEKCPTAYQFPIPDSQFPIRDARFPIPRVIGKRFCSTLRKERKPCKAM